MFLVAFNDRDQRPSCHWSRHQVGVEETTCAVRCLDQSRFGGIRFQLSARAQNWNIDASVVHPHATGVRCPLSLCDGRSVGDIGTCHGDAGFQLLLAAERQETLGSEH